MKSKSWLKYFIVIIILIFMVFSAQYFVISVNEKFQQTFNTPYLFYFIMGIFYGGIGSLLGLEQLIKEIKKQGKWSLNIPKLIFMVLPSLYFSLAFFIYYNNISFLRVLSSPLSILMHGTARFIPIFQLILGYSIITSFYKKNEVI